MKTEFKKLTDIGKHKYLRVDTEYWFWYDIVNEKINNYVLLKDIFKFVNGSVQTSNYVDEITTIPYVRISDLDYRHGISTEDFIYLSEDVSINKEKILRNDDIIFTTIGSVGKVSLCEKAVDGTFSNNTVVLRSDSLDSIEKKYYEKLLQTDFYKQYSYMIASHKVQPNLQPYDLSNIRIPIVSKEEMANFVSSISPSEKKIDALFKKIRPVQEIIDESFRVRFGLDYTRFNELNSIKRYTSSLSAFSNNPDLRFSAKFHRSAGDYVVSELMRIPHKKIKKFLKEPIILGASVSPSNFDERGHAYYISMASIKTYEVVLDDTQLLSEEYYDKYGYKDVKPGDIIIARSGVAIGKTALVKEEFDGVFADFTMRIRLKNYNTQFAYYYFRSKYFQYLIEIYKKGCQNQNIFPIVMQEFPLIDISLEEQQKFVDQIEEEINKQNKIRDNINSLRDSMDDYLKFTV